MELKIGDSMFRYISMSGIHKFTVIGVHQYETVCQYVVRDENCSHGWKCEMLITKDSKGKYRYRLHSNSSWTIINEPQITLLNPEDGIYDLEVSFLNENNKWSENEKLTSFEVKPPFWKTIYFKILIVLVIFYSIFLFFKYKKRQFETKQKLLILEQKALFAHALFQAQCGKPPHASHTFPDDLSARLVQILFDSDRDQLCFCIHIARHK